MAKNACGKCGGSGYIPQYSNYAGGVCFDCGGSGVERAGRGSSRSERVELPPTKAPPSKAIIVCGVPCHVIKHGAHDFELQPDVLSDGSGLWFDTRGGTVHVSDGSGYTLAAFGYRSPPEDAPTRVFEAAWRRVLDRIQADLQRQLRK